MAHLKALLITVLVYLMQESKSEGNIPKPQITRIPANVVYETEKIIFKCNVQGASSDLEYIWQKGDDPLPGSENTYTIMSADPSHNGNYQCKVNKGNDTSGPSDLLPLSVAGKPKPQLTKDPASVSVFYTKESVTLKCEVTEPLEGWTYLWYKGEEKKLIPNTGSQSQHTISSVVPADGGSYWCQVERSGFKSDYSDSLSLEIKDFPQTKLVMQTKWTKFFPSEVVKMKCDIQPPSPDWTCKYYRNDQEIQESNCMFNLQSAKTGDSGVYKCSATHRSLETQHSNPIDVRVYEGTPKPLLTRDPASVRVFYTKESVVLKCDITEDSEGWTYLWYKGEEKKIIPNTGSQSQHTLSSVAPADGGSYWCQVERDGFKSDYSDSLTLVIKDFPQTSLVMQTKWTKFFPSEVVKMTCNIQPPSPDWICKYYRNDQELQTRDCMLNLQSATTGDSGVYKCSGTHRSLETQHSNPKDVHVYGGRPKPQLTRDPASVRVFYTKESVSLKCDITEDSEGWTYLWYKGKEKKLITNTGSQSQHTLSSVAAADGGSYWCQVERAVFKSDYSDSLTLEIKDLPQTTLVMQTKWTKVFPSEVVKMKCDIQPPSPDWICKFYRNDQELQTSDCMLNLQSAKTGDSGDYKCSATHRSLKTQDSNPIKVKVYDHQPKLLLSVNPNDPPIYTNENVTLTCHVQDVQEGWTYMWYKDSNQNTPVNQTSESVYTLPSVQLSHNGQYKCQVKRENLVSEYSGSRGLTIQDPPVPNLERLSKWAKVFPTEEVSMKCNGIPSSPGWTYKWYREQQPLSGDTDTHLIRSVDTKHTGEYTCQGVHKRHVETVVSDSISIHVYGNKAEPTLSLHPNNAIYMEEQMTFTCEVESDSSDWEYQWFRNNPQEQIRGFDPRNATYTIKSASGKDDGEFWCKTKRGAYVSEFSKPIKIKISARPTAVVNLETGWADILSVDSLTLLCEVDNKSIAWNYTWYKDGEEIANETQKALHIKATKENYRSEYSCKGIQTNRPTYSMISEAFIANNIVLKRQILLAISGCLVVGFVLIVLGCIYFKFTRKPEEESKPEPDLFFTTAELKKRADIGSTTELCLVERVDDKPPIAEKPEDLDELLKEAKDSQNEEKANGLESFKGS